MINGKVTTEELFNIIGRQTVTIEMLNQEIEQLRLAVQQLQNDKDNKNSTEGKGEGITIAKEAVTQKR